MKGHSRIKLLLVVVSLCAGILPLHAAWLLEDVPVCTQQAAQQHAVVSPDGTGGILVAWEDGRNDDIFAQRYGADGAALWTPGGVDVTGMPGNQRLPRIVPDGTGGAFIAFESDSSTGWTCREARIFSVVGVAYLDQNGTVQWKRRISAAPDASWFEHIKEMTPAAFPDGEGGAVITWTAEHELYVDYYGCTNPLYCCWWLEQDHYVQKIDAGGSLLWGEGPRLLSTDDVFASGLDAAVDASGATYLVWCDRTPSDGPKHIYIQKLNMAGDALWGPNRIIAGMYSSWKESPRITSDGSGGAVIAWKDNRDTNHQHYKVFAQRVDSLGNAVWMEGGVLVSGTPGEKLDVGIIPSGPEHYIISWTDDTGGAPALFTQRLDPCGAPLWRTGGIMVSDGVDRCVNACLVPDGEGGAVLAWEQAPAAGGSALNDIFGFSRSAIFAVGEGGIILRYNGSSWDEMESGTTADLYGVWGSLPNNMYAVGAGGTILHCTGVTWTPMPVDTTLDLHGIWGSSADDIFAVGESSVILHFDGTGWRRMGDTSHYSRIIMGVHGNAPDNAYEVWCNGMGLGGVVRYDGTHWGCVWCCCGDYYGVWVSRDGAVFASGCKAYDYVGLVSSYDGEDWENIVFPIRSTGRGVWGDSADNVYVVFDGGYIAHFDGVEWVLSRAATGDLLDVWGPLGDNIWIVGENRLIRHWENGEWVTQFMAGSDIMVQRVNELGEPQWDEHGTPVTVDVDAQVDPHLSHDPAGRILLAWKDSRNGNWDIYGRTVSISDGPIVAAELFGFEASASVNGIEVSWQLSRYRDGAHFIVSRSEGGKNVTWRRVVPRIERRDLSFSFDDPYPEPGRTYRYRVTISDASGERLLFETDHIDIPTPPIALFQNVPNPFNPSTTIRYYLPREERVTLVVHDVRGGLVSCIVRDELRERGYHAVEWSGVDISGRPVASGVYFYRLRVGKETIARKLVIVK